MLGRVCKVFGEIALALSIATVSYGLTAASAVPATKSGDGSGAVSGYTASAISYTLDATSPQNIDSVTMTLSATPAAGSTLKAQLAPAGSWYTCSNAGTSVTCATTSPQATAVAATQLRLVVAD